MKALSIQQPWSWLIVNGFKDIENRSWPTKLRGRIKVHAGKTFDKEGYDWVKDNFPRIIFPPIDDFKFIMGGIVGEIDIVDCVIESDSPWFFGDYGFVLSNPRWLPVVPLRGQLSFFEVGDL